ncbi:MAG: hypothetical protein CVV64_00510 [Candidatus Wallbacteria bacterium HGW-Wallbacteria-1]|uniref:Tetratricopeptide repeat protein n=1 Tax=Candidatus Wallbacteria bacterium HGW-Wallbacteria-1 TaxID=2013854 RepID=A0A2N1PUH2_9BACT|nr:MAG: hypothetical protein CVV64_00510 [Candidatus Wallbacteria bacterium HGW-Wallbacteria-1]
MLRGNCLFLNIFIQITGILLMTTLAGAEGTETPLPGMGRDFRVVVMTPAKGETGGDFTALKKSRQPILSESVTSAMATVRVRPSDPSAWIEMGRSYFLAGMYADSEMAFRRTISIDRESSAAWRGAALCRLAMGRGGAALEAFSHAGIDGRINFPATFIRDAIVKIEGSDISGASEDIGRIMTLLHMGVLRNSGREIRAMKALVRIGFVPEGKFLGIINGSHDIWLPISDSIHGLSGNMKPVPVRITRRSEDGVEICELTNDTCGFLVDLPGTEGSADIFLWLSGHEARGFALTDQPLKELHVIGMEKSDFVPVGLRSSGKPRERVEVKIGLLVMTAADRFGKESRHLETRQKP